MNTEDCGKLIVELRKSNGLTQKELAEKLDVTDKAVSRWETGKGYPDISSLVALSELFGITVNELLAGECVEPECLPELADKNLLNAIEQNECNKKRGLIQTIIAIVCLIAIFIPPVIAIVEEIIELNPVVDDESVANFIIQTMVAILLVVSGICIRAGHITLIHSYHYTRVTDREGYCKAMAKPMILMGVVVFLGGSLLLLRSVHPIVEIISSVIILGGCAGCVVWLFKEQYKYNNGLF